MAHIPHDEFMKIWKKKPVAIADCVIIKGNKVLLVKRATPPFMGMWSVVGGMMEVGETIEQTAVREVREETGIKARVISLIGVYSGNKRDPRGTTISAAFLMRPLKFGGKTDGEISEMKFFNFDELPKKIAFDHHQIIGDALKLLRQKKRK